MSRIIRSIFTFYKSFITLSMLISFISLAVIANSEFKLFIIMFWFKIAVTAIIVYFINDNKRKEFYYYQNLGISKTILWVSTISLDLLLFLFTAFLISLIK